MHIASLLQLLELNHIYSRIGHPLLAKSPQAMPNSYSIFSGIDLSFEGQQFFSFASRFSSPDDDQHRPPPDNN